MQSEQPRRRKIRLLTRLAEADKQIGKLRLLKTEMMHRLAEAEFRLLPDFVSAPLFLFGYGKEAGRQWQIVHMAHR